jgi:hypothetical protein
MLFFTHIVKTYGKSYINGRRLFFEKHNAKPHAKQGEPAAEFLRAERETSTEYMNNLQKP